MNIEKCWSQSEKIKNLSHDEAGRDSGLGQPLVEQDEQRHQRVHLQIELERPCLDEAGLVGRGLRVVEVAGEQEQMDEIRGRVAVLAHAGGGLGVLST